MEMEDRYADREDVPRLSKEFVSLRQQLLSELRAKVDDYEFKEDQTDSGLFLLLTVKFLNKTHTFWSDAIERPKWVDDMESAEEQHIEFYKKVLSQLPDLLKPKEEPKHVERTEEIGRDWPDVPRLGGKTGWFRVRGQGS